MAEQIALHDWIAWDGFDISGVTNNAPFDWRQEVKEFLCFKPATAVEADSLNRKRLPGPEDASMAIAGYLDFTSNYAAANASIGVADAILTRGFGRALGSKCYLLQGVQGKFDIGGPVGEVVPFSADLSVSNSIIVPGMLFEFDAKTATGDGTTQTIGAASVSQKLYLHAHVVAVSGVSPTLDLIYESSSSGAFAGEEITRFTFAQFTDVSARVQRGVVNGAITDTRGRFAWTISGTGSPSFLLRLAAGIR